MSAEYLDLGAILSRKSAHNEIRVKEFVFLYAK